MDFPKERSDANTLLSKLETLKSDDLRWKQGRAFSYVYYASPEITETLSKAYLSYFSENALNPSAFPSLSIMQSEVISMCKSLFNAGDNAGGVMTSGGTESILMAIKAAKEYAKKYRNITAPEVIMPLSAHPAFNKACDYFGVKLHILPVGSDYRVNPESYEGLINENTVLLVASAPSYPQGVVDPIPEIGQVALKHKIPFHVDACVGGFVLPFIKDRTFPNFDLGVPGVTSLSADIHKYGFASKGSSVVLYNDNELRKSQFYIYTGWPGGIYASPSIMGTRPGGAIAVAWTVLQLLGQAGYESLVQKMMSTAKAYQDFLSSYEGISVVGSSDMCIFSIQADGFNIYELGDEMHELSWQMDRQQDPSALHLSISPIHAEVFEDFKIDFDKAYKIAKKKDFNKLKNSLQVGAAKGLKKILPEKTFGKLQKLAVQKSDTNTNRSAALYGMIGDLKGSGTLDEMIIEFLDKMTK
ncbi:pyridoxal phosphate-dependent decarboxylase family protein [Portibacter lacus]|uniref:Aspartate aminotransferase family protein n=1 Tax=Portibacter lacus TaxID=1099794 RepID=A0AA37SLJ5_9BACT|nr:aspartate aminotransferase family protein [Portibacter lacus]GLR16441.1 aspartate aminotransferase family protein [Portibacter lacus]